MRGLLRATSNGRPRLFYRPRPPFPANWTTRHDGLGIAIIYSPILLRKQDRNLDPPRCVSAAVVNDPRDNPPRGVKGRLNLRHS